MHVPDRASARARGPAGKPGGKADREALRAQLTAVGMGVPAIAAELRARFGYRPRPAYRFAHGWSQDDAAREYNARHHTDTMTRERVSDYETWPHGGRRPSPPTLANLASLYGATPADLCDLDDLAAMPPADRRLILGGQPTRPEPAGCLTVPTRTRSVEARPIRPFREDQLEAEFVMAASHESFDHAASTGQTNVGESQLEQLHEEVYRIATDYGVVPPSRSYQHMYMLREAIYTLLDGQQRPSQRADLILIAGQIVGLMGHASSDLGYYDAAVEQARAAFMYGEMIGHPGLCAFASGELGIAYNGAEQVHKALKHIRRGLRIAPSGKAVARLRSLEASYCATIGHVTAAKAALVAAGEALEHDQRADELFDISRGPLGFNHARRAQVAANAYLRLGEYDAAISSARDTLAMYATGDVPRLFGTEALARAAVATGHAGAGRLDGAQETLAEVLALPPEMRIAPVNRRLRELNRLLARRYGADPASRALSEQIEDFTHTPAGGALPSPPPGARP